MNFEDYIKPELLVLIPVLYLVGLAIKKSNLNDRWIPIVLALPASCWRDCTFLRQRICPAGKTL